MNVIFLLIGISVLVALSFLAIFLWNVKSGQYDDAETPSIRMLFEDNLKTNNNKYGEDQLR